MNTSPNGQSAIKGHEAFRDRAYKPTPHDVWTIGYGFTTLNGEPVRDGQYMSRTDADRLFQAQLDPYEDAVMGLCSIPPNQNQFDALVSLCFNIGIKGFAGSTVLKCHNKGDFQAAARAFSLWNKQAGVVLNGLVSRRAQEAALYLTPVGGQASNPMPQTVDPETTFVQSNINKGGIIATGAGGLAVIQPIVDAVNAFKNGVDGLGTWLVPLLIVVAVVAAGWMIWERVKLRKKGIL